jgi:hypothetical protein
VIHFINNGAGKAFTMQMLVGGPDQASYFPALAKVLKSPHSFIAETSAMNAGFTNFTDYAVAATRVRSYHFFTAAFSVPDSGSTLLLLALALGLLFVIHRRLTQKRLVVRRG